MAISTFEVHDGAPGYGTAVGLIVRAAIGLFVHGLLGLGGAGRLDRKTGIVRRI